MSSEIPTAPEEKFYVQHPGNTEPKGPYSLDQLQTLANAGKLERTALIYLADREEWQAIESVEHLREAIFPRKETVKLKLRAAGGSNAEPAKPGQMPSPSPIAPEPEAPKILVTDMLANAEGASEETQHLKKREREKQAAASISSSVLGISYLLMAAAGIIPHVGYLSHMPDGFSWEPLLQRPLVFIGLFDAIIGLILMLSMTLIYPLARLRAMLGLGFFGYFFWSLEGHHYAIAVALFAFGIMVCSWTLRLPLMILGAIAAIGSAAFLLLNAINGDLGAFLSFR